MGSVGWGDLEVQVDAERPGRFTAEIADRWRLTTIPQGGAVAVLAARAMTAALGRPDQTLRSLTAVFAGQVACGPVEIDVTELRRGRSMSQLSATVRNPGAAAGLTAVAVFGGERPGVEFTELEPPRVPPPEDLWSFRDPVPAGVEFEWARPPMPLWEQVAESRPALGRAPWDPHEHGPAEIATWRRLDDPPLLDDGRLDPVSAFVLCDTMPGAVDQKIGPDAGLWWGPSADLTIHLFGAATPGWLLAHNRARHAGDGYASVEMALWDPADWSLVAYATQLMFFAFGR